jgi:hypothetical protein
MKMPAVVVASCSAAPLKAPRRRSSKSGNVNVDETTSSSVQLAKTKSLESTKHKRRSSEHISDADLQAASSLTQLSRKKAKKLLRRLLLLKFDEFLLLSMMTPSRNLARKVFPLILS